MGRTYSMLFFALAALLLVPSRLSHEVSDAFSLNTYFLSTSTFSLVADNVEQGLYNFTFPLLSAPPVMPLLHPSKSGMQHAFLNTAQFFKDLAYLSFSSAGKGFVRTGAAATAQTVDPAGSYPGCHDMVVEAAGKDGTRAPTSVLLGLSGTEAMAVFDMMDVSLRRLDNAVVMKLRLVENPHLMSEFDPHPKQKIHHEDQHYHFFPNGGFLLDAKKVLAVAGNEDLECKVDGRKNERQAVVFLKGTPSPPPGPFEECSVGGTPCSGGTICCFDILGGGPCLCLFPSGTTLPPIDPSNDPKEACCSNDVTTPVLPGEELKCKGFNYPCAGQGVADPHFVGFDGTKYEVGNSAEAKGHIYSILSANNFAFNSLFDRAPGPDRWPFWGTWMRAFGVHHAEGLSLEIALKPGMEFPEIKDSGCVESNRSVLPAGGFSKVLVVSVNGKDASSYIESGETLDMGKGLSLHFPNKDQKHPQDNSDGPVLSITLPEIKVTIYLETEEVAHLDFAVQLRMVTDMHGLLGQTVNWMNSGAVKAVQGEESEYIVSSLMATDFQYSLFGKSQGRGRSLIGARLDEVIVGGSSETLVRQARKRQAALEPNQA